MPVSFCVPVTTPPADCDQLVSRSYCAVDESLSLAARSAWVVVEMPPEVDEESDEYDSIRC